MAIPIKKKLPELRAFYEHIHDPAFTYPCGYGNYVQLMDEYPKVTAVFLGLKKEYRSESTAGWDVWKDEGAGAGDGPQCTTRASVGVTRCHSVTLGVTRCHSESSTRRPSTPNPPLPKHKRTHIGRCVCVTRAFRALDVAGR